MTSENSRKPVYMRFSNCGNDVYRDCQTFKLSKLKGHMRHT